MVRTTLLCCLMALSAANAWSQMLAAPPENKGIVYSRETAFNIKLATNRGLVPGMEFGRLRTYYKTTYFHVSVGEIKDPKEQRQSAEQRLGQSFRPYVYGKQNNFYVVRSGWGIKRYYSEKAKQRGVAVGISYNVGPTLGLLKPYYLALVRESSNSFTEEKYSSENADLFLNQNRIRGASPFTKGLDEIRFRPGVNASIALHLDWGAFDEFVKALEIGAMLDVFPSKIPILVGDNNNHQVFLNFFVNLQLGKRK